MFGFFKKKATDATPTKTPQTATPTAPAAASPTKLQPDGIAYYPHLIKDLVGDHRQLQNLQDQIAMAYKQGQYKQISALLEEFGSTLRNHLLTENLRLYVYLQQQMKGNEASVKLVRDFRKEMDGIAREGLAFLDKYSHIEALSPQEQSQFLNELNAIGEIIHERMQREERDLYPLYAKHAS